MEDDGEHLDKDVVKDWGMVAAAWTAGFLELEGWIEEKKEGGRVLVKRGEIPLMSLRDEL